MEIDPDTLEKVKSNSVEFTKLYEEHIQLKTRVEELNKMKYLTPEQELEKKRIQKQKLQGKDRMNEIIDEFQANTH